MSCASHFSLAAQPHADPTTALKLAGYGVTYQDEKGQAISGEQFAAGLAASKPFTIAKEPERKTAVASLASRDALLQQQPELAVKRGEAVPALTGTNVDGQTLTVPASDGRYTLLAFFFANCAPCVAEIPDLNELGKAHPDVRVVGVTYDPLASTRKLAARHGIQYTTLSDARGSIDRLGVKSYPTLLLVKPDGTLAGVNTGGIKPTGATTQKQVLEAWLKRSMADAGPRT